MSHDAGAEMITMMAITTTLSHFSQMPKHLRAARSHERPPSSPEGSRWGSFCAHSGLCNTRRMEQVSAHTQWMIDGSGVPAPVNQIMLHGGVNLVTGASAGECYVVFGHGMPPIIDPTTLEPGASVFVPIIPVGQFAISVERLREFHGVIGDFLAQQDQITG